MSHTPPVAPVQAQQDILRSVPPHDLRAEAAVLGGILVDPAALAEVAEVLTPDDFYSPVHRQVFGISVQLANSSRPVDLVTVSEALGKRLPDIGGTAYLAELAEGAVGLSNAVHHARIVKSRSVERAIINAASGIITKVFDGGHDAPALLDDAARTLMDLSVRTSGNGAVPVWTAFQDAVAVVEKRCRTGKSTGVSTGLHDLDVITWGYQPSDLIIMAGRPSMGKTALSIRSAWRGAAARGIPVAFFSLEQPRQQIIERLIAAETKIPLELIRKGKLQDSDWTKVHDFAQDVQKAPLYIDDSGGLTLSQIRARTRRMVREHGVKIVYIDYLQLINPDHRDQSREREVSDLSRGLKGLAKELDIPVVALSQLNRKVEDRTSKRPVMSDLRDSGSLEQDADVIQFVYRDEVYNKAMDNPNRGIAEIILSKQRNGPTGVVKAVFLGECTTFENMSWKTGYPA